MTKQILHSVVLMVAIGFATQAVQAADYQVTFTTGNVYLAGTDMNVTIRVYGKDFTTKKTVYTQKINANKLIAGNAFERAAVETIAFSDPANLRPEGVEVTTTRIGGVKDDWNLESVKVFANFTTINAAGQLSNTATGAFYGYRDWVGTGTRSINRLESHYRVGLYTGNKSGAGTDSNITIEIHGTHGVTSAVPLNGLIDGDAFEAGDVDSVSFAGKNVGEITGVKIVSDNSYAGSDWYLNKVTVSQDGAGAKTFNVNSWFTSDKPTHEAGVQYSR